MYDFHNSALSPIQTILLNAAILSIIVVSLMRSERSLRSQSQWTMLALLFVFGVSGRILLDPLPNVQPVTVLVLLAGVYYGAPRAFALAATIALASNILYLGHGPWTIFQAVGWGLVGVLGAALADRLIVDGQLRIQLVRVSKHPSGTRLIDASALFTKRTFIRPLSRSGQYSIRSLDVRASRRDDA